MEKQVPMTIALQTVTKQYIFDQTGLWLSVEKTDTMDEKIKPNTW